MLNLGPVEILVVFGLALIVLGPRKLPEIARHLGKFYGLIRRTTYELKHTLDQELLDEERQTRRAAAELRREEFRQKRLDKEEPLPVPPPGPQVAPEAAPLIEAAPEDAASEPESSSGDSP